MWRGIGHAAGMGHLEKAVLCQFWPNAHRLEQGVIPRIAGHGQLLIE
jgi:hypothetical protein